MTSHALTAIRLGRLAFLLAAAPGSGALAQPFTDTESLEVRANVTELEDLSVSVLSHLEFGSIQYIIDDPTRPPRLAGHRIMWPMTAVSPFVRRAHLTCRTAI